MNIFVCKEYLVFEEWGEFVKVEVIFVISVVIDRVVDIVDFIWEVVELFVYVSNSDVIMSIDFLNKESIF